MKRIFAVTTLTVVMGQGMVLMAQKPSEPPIAESPASGLAGSSQNGTRSVRKSSTPSAPSSFSTALSINGSRGDSIPPVMIRFSSTDAKAAAALEEDLFVMARVIGRTLERAETDKVRYKLGVPMLLTGSGRSVRPMYLEGLGPLFMIKVNFPVMPPPKPDSNKAAAATEDSEWIEAQKDLYGTAETSSSDESVGHASAYNEEQVTLLKKELVGALKNAANIRGLRPEEFVNIAVFGHASFSAFTRGGEGGGRYNAKSLAVDDSGSGKGSVLTLRARKSDIDALSNGKIDETDFKSKVAVTAYPGSGSSITSINSWIQESAGRLRLQ